MDRYDYLFLTNLGQYFKTIEDYMVKKDGKEVLNRLVSIFVHQIVESAHENHPDEKVTSDHIIQIIENIYEDVADDLIEDINKAIGAFNDFSGSKRIGTSKKANLLISTNKIRRICLHNQMTRFEIETLVAIAAAVESLLSHLMQEVVPKTRNKHGRELVRAVDILAIADLETAYANLFLTLIQTKL